MIWQLEKIEQYDNGATGVTLVCESDSETKKIWPYEFKLSLNVQVGIYLTLNLTTQNLNDQDIEITEALHTYFSVDDPRGVVVQGLEGSIHIDKLEDSAPEIQRETVEVYPAKDSVYLDQAGKALIEDKGNNRRMVIEKRNSRSSVVWNPGPEIVKGFTDIDDDAWLDFVCVETGNVLDDVVTVAANSEHTLSVQYLILAG